MKTVNRARNRRIGKLGAGLLFLLICGGVALPARAGIKQINVQGKLTDSSGNPLSNPTVTFRLYTATSPSSQALWSSTMMVATTSGTFSTTLQDGTPSLDSITFNIPYYLGIQVGADTEMTPRQLLGASAYSLGSLGDFNVGGNLSAVGVSASTAAVSFLNLSGRWDLSSTAQISSNMSVSGKTFLNNQGNTALTIQGFADGDPGQIIVFTNNTSASNVTFVQSGSGTKQFMLPFSQNLVIGPRSGAIFIYDSLAGGWICTGTVSANGQILGTATNDSAVAGNVGEYIPSLISNQTGHPANSWTNVTSLALTAGDWDVTGIFEMFLNGATTTNGVSGAISLRSGGDVSDQVNGQNQIDNYAGSGPIFVVPIPSWRVSLSSPATVYLKIQPGNYSGGSGPSVYGRMSARRVR